MEEIAFNFSGENVGAMVEDIAHVVHDNTYSPYISSDTCLVLHRTQALFVI